MIHDPEFWHERVLRVLERYFSWIAIPHAIRGLVALKAGVFLLGMLEPRFYEHIALNPHAIANGEVWRLITGLLVPSSDFILFAIIELQLLWMMGEALEGAIGPFRMTLFLLMGAVGVWMGMVVGGPQFAVLGPFLFVESILFAFAFLFPEFPILLFFILPLKMKWVALIASLVLSAAVLRNPGVAPAIVLSLLNFGFFFLPVWFESLRRSADAAQRQRTFRAAQERDESSFHRCTVCGRTERSDPGLAFRVAADGEEYCVEHLPKRETAGNPVAGSGDG